MRLPLYLSIPFIVPEHAIDKKTVVVSTINRTGFLILLSFLRGVVTYLQAIENATDVDELF